MTYWKTCPDCDGEGVIEQIEAPTGRPFCFPCRCGSGMVPVAEGTIVEMNEESIRDELIVKAASPWDYNEAVGSHIAPTQTELAPGRYVVLRAAAEEET